MSSLRESWLLGPPGTGKTTTLSSMVGDAVREYGGDGVLVSSFTKAAAVELTGRNLPITDGRVGTLHALCYRALGMPPIAESCIKEFNADSDPDMALASFSTDTEDGVWEYSGRNVADDYFASYQAQRARMIPFMKMQFNGMSDTAFMRFVLAWEGWKSKKGYMDFSDLLEKALHDMDGPPLDAKVLFVDEAQDCVPLMMAVARKWATSMERLVLAFDEDQSLYSWAGADPEQLFSTEPSEPATVLAQSYRVPRAVHASADRMRGMLSWRIPKEYLPRNADGFVKTSWNLDYAHPGPTVNIVKDLISDGKTVMILASCGYMLRDVIEEMKQRGIPFGNVYKPRRAEWNPLDLGTAYRMTPARRVQLYLRGSGESDHVWDTEEFKAWAPHIRSDDLFRRGTKARLVAKDFALPPTTEERLNEIGGMLTDESDGEFGRAVSGDLDWLNDRLMGDVGKRMRYPLRVAREMGPKALLERPRVTVGTIHSVKGAEADVVILHPDISALGDDEWRSDGSRRDSIIRMFYVAMTRAREGLIITGSASARYVPSLGA